MIRLRRSIPTVSLRMAQYVKMPSTMRLLMYSGIAESSLVLMRKAVRIRADAPVTIRSVRFTYLRFMIGSNE